MRVFKYYNEVQLLKRWLFWLFSCHLKHTHDYEYAYLIHIMYEYTVYYVLHKQFSSDCNEVLACWHQQRMLIYNLLIYAGPEIVSK